MAPEILKKKYYDHKVDIYSLGNTLYEILFGKCCYESKDMAELVKKVEIGHIDFSNDPRERITWEEIFNYDLSFATKRSNRERSRDVA